MKKVYDIEVDCANCARKMEEATRRVEGVASAGINFMMQKMEVDYKDGVDEKKVLKEIYKTCRKVEPDFEIE